VHPGMVAYQSLAVGVAIGESPDSLGRTIAAEVGVRVGMLATAPETRVIDAGGHTLYAP
jgi:hypothetical protein